jgi:hypothetical protein
MIFTEMDIRENYPLQNYDAIMVPDITERRPAAALSRLERRITVRGAVRRPGTYELGPAENLRDLIEVYADGLTPRADKNRMELIRYEGTTSSVGERISLKESHIAGDFALQNYDIITIPDISEWWPITSEEPAVQRAAH